MIESFKLLVNRFNLYIINVIREFCCKYLVIIGRDMFIEGKGGGWRKVWLSRIFIDV